MCLVVAAMLLPGPVAMGDVVYLISGRPGHQVKLKLEGVTIADIRKDGDTEFLYYVSNATGHAFGKPIRTVAQIEVEGETLFNQAEDEFARGDLKTAGEDYRKTIEKPNAKNWIKVRAAERLLDISAKTGDFLSAVAGFVELARKDPAAAAQHKPAIDKDIRKDLLDQAIATVNAGMEGSTTDTKLALYSFLADVYHANGQSDKAAAVAAEIQKLQGASASAVQPAPATQPVDPPAADPRIAKALDALREMNNPQSRLTYAEKLRGARDIAENIDLILPTIKDPLAMMRMAAVLTEFGLNPQVNSLEYWGEDPAAQARLKPLSSAVIKLYAAAGKTAATKANDLTKADLNNPMVADKWEAMDNLAKLADYSRNMSVYFDCIATDPGVMVDSRRRVLTPTEIAATRRLNMIRLRFLMASEAIAGLTEYDNPDTQVQPRIRNMIAKLYMAAGEYRKAKETFATVYREPTDVKPAPNGLEQWEARYFTIVADVLNRDLPSAEGGKRDFDLWRMNLRDLIAKLNLSAKSLADIDSGVYVAAEILQWRIDLLKGDLAGNNEVERSRADDAATAVLTKLRASRPEFAPQIDQQLAAFAQRRKGGVAAAVNVDKSDSVMDILRAIDIGVGTSGGGDAGPKGDHRNSRPGESGPQTVGPPAGGGIGPQGPLFGAGGNARRIAFVCDASGSMINKMPTLKDQLGKAIMALRPIQSFEIIFFQDAKFWSFMKFANQNALVLATPDAKRNMNKFLEGVTTTGTTDPIPGIEAAFKTRPQLIYLLTDGDFPDNDMVLKTIRDLEKNQNPKIKINTIAFVGDGDNEVAFLDLLKTIAKETGGTFRHVKESEL